MEGKKPVPRKRVAKKAVEVAPVVEKRLVWKWLTETQELVQIEVDA